MKGPEKEMRSACCVHIPWLVMRGALYLQKYPAGGLWGVYGTWLHICATEKLPQQDWKSYRQAYHLRHVPTSSNFMVGFAGGSGVIKGLPRRGKGPCARFLQAAT